MFRLFIKDEQGNPRRGFPTQKQSHRTVFVSPPALFKEKEFRTLRSATWALPLDPTSF